MAEQPGAAAERSTLARAVGVTVLQTVAEYIPTGWQALVLSPPVHPNAMTWHIHLAADIRLELADGRAVAAGPPSDRHAWTLPNGRQASVGNGDPLPTPGDSTTAIRVGGPHVAVSLGDASIDLLCTDGRGRRHTLRASARDLRRVADALRQAIDLGLSSRIGGHASALSYSLSSWRAHSRAWIIVAER